MVPSTLFLSFLYQLVSLLATVKPRMPCFPTPSTATLLPSLDIQLTYISDTYHSPCSPCQPPKTNLPYGLCLPRGSTARAPTGISRDSRHKRRETGGRRSKYRKKRKFEMGRPPANTKLGGKRVHPVRCRGGNMKYRALRLDTGNFSWGTEGETSILPPLCM